MKFLDINEFKRLYTEGVWLIDTRPTQSFADGFIKGAISIPFNENFKDKLNDLVEDRQSLLLISTEVNAAPVSKAVALAGNFVLLGVLSLVHEEWNLSAKETDLLISIDVEEFAIDYNFDEFFLIDVRGAEAFEEEHLEHAENIALSDLEQTLTDMETNESYYICATNFEEAATAASVFKQNGFERVRVLDANFTDLKNTKLPFVIKKKDKTDSRFTNN